MDKLDHQDQEENLANLDHKVTVENLVHPVQMDSPDQEENRDHQVHQVRQVIRDHRDHVVNQGRQDHKASEEKPDNAEKMVIFFDNESEKLDLEIKLNYSFLYQLQIY